jgi:hypothetical protein
MAGYDWLEFWKARKAYRNFVRKCLENLPLGLLKRGWEGKYRTDLR